MQWIAVKLPGTCFRKRQWIGRRLIAWTNSVDHSRIDRYSIAGIAKGADLRLNGSVQFAVRLAPYDFRPVGWAAVLERNLGCNQFSALNRLFL